MFLIESNVDRAIGRTRKLNRNIPIAMQEALAPNLWLAQARLVALRTLLALARLEERQFIHPFVNTVSAEIVGAALSLKMHSPFGEESPDKVLANARAAAAALTPKEIVQIRGLSLFMQPVENFETMILEWVQGGSATGDVPFPDEQEKRKDARDWGRSDEDVARFISHLLLTPDPTERELTAREKLEPHIAKFIANRLAGQLSQAVAEIWLKAVMAAWRALLRSAYPEKLQAICGKR